MQTLTKNELYERVRSVCHLTESEFERAFDYAECELVSLYGEVNVYETCGNTLRLRAHYLPAVGSEILFSLRGKEEDHERFVSRSKSAFLTVWKERVKAAVKGEKA